MATYKLEVIRRGINHMKTSDEIKKEVREDICIELKNSGCFTPDMIEKFIDVFDECSKKYTFRYDGEQPCDRIAKVL